MENVYFPAKDGFTRNVIFFFRYSAESTGRLREQLAQVNHVHTYSTVHGSVYHSTSEQRNKKYLKVSCLFNEIYNQEFFL